MGALGKMPAVVVVIRQNQPLTPIVPYLGARDPPVDMASTTRTNDLDLPPAAPVRPDLPGRRFCPVDMTKYRRMIRVIHNRRRRLPGDALDPLPVNDPK